MKGYWKDREEPEAVAAEAPEEPIENGDGDVE